MHGGLKVYHGAAAAARHYVEADRSRADDYYLAAPVNTVRWWRQTGTGPDFFKIGRRLYTTVGDLRRFIRAQRLASQPVIRRPKAV